jgi:hypothetical protein
MKFNPVCENDICVGECICNPWNECLEESDTHKKCLRCKAPLSDEDDPDLCEKCGGIE